MVNAVPTTLAIPTTLPRKPSTLGLVLIWILAVITLLYLLPTSIAFSRGHKDTMPVFLINLFLGWTLVGWIVSLVWAVKSFKA